MPGMSDAATPPNDMAMGCYLFIWGILSVILFAGTIAKKAPIMLSIVFFTVVILFALLAGSHWAALDAQKAWGKVAGIEGVICGLSAIYMAAAEILNSLSGKTILWVGIRSYASP